MIKQTQIQEDNLQVFKKGLVKALCILFSNLKFKIQWKLASNSWPKTDTIKKTHQETKEALMIPTFAFVMAKRRKRPWPHPWHTALYWVALLTKWPRGKASVTFLECYLPTRAPPRQPTHRGPRGWGIPLHFMSQAGGWAGNRDLSSEHVGNVLGVGENETIHLENPKRYCTMVLFSSNCTVGRFSTATIK